MSVLNLHSPAMMDHDCWMTVLQVINRTCTINAYLYHLPLVASMGMTQN